MRERSRSRIPFFKPKAPLIHLGRKKAEARYELYDLNADPMESDNLVEKQPELTKQLRSVMDAWRASMNARFAGDVGQRAQRRDAHLCRYRRPDHSRQPDRPVTVCEHHRPLHRTQRRPSLGLGTVSGG